MGVFTETTASITVSVEPTPLVEESNPEQGAFAFAYSVRIENGSDSTIQLLERQWIIESADVQIGEVVGPGVVGVQPVLGPGESFEYTSSAVIKDPIGAMSGMYVFNRKGEGFFVVRIPRFRLLFPSLVH